jgi:hypothetical protein
MEFTRKGDPDPRVGLVEVFTPARKYSHLEFRMGHVLVRMYGDRYRALRTVKHLADEINSKLGGLWPRPGGDASPFAPTSNASVILSHDLGTSIDRGGRTNKVPLHERVRRPRRARKVKRSTSS